MNRVSRGFTLIEVLVAMSVFAVMALVVTGIASAALDRRAALDDVDNTLRQLQITKALIRADLTQLAKRPVRDAFGASVQSGKGSLNASDQRSMLSFVRGGSNNPDGLAARSSLQWVAYAIEDGALVRKSREYLDPTPNTPTTVTTLISGATDARVLFLAADGWLERTQIPVNNAASLPPAVAFEIDVNGLGEVQLAFEVPQL